ncbi:MAG: HDIG domain-containing protein [Methanomassiliicoccales archaeon]|nr:HDIG domain-containing protein [Methanomassiliicoccales archaeon]
MSSTPTMPSERECLDILREEGCKSNVIEHVCTVHSIAAEMARLSSADRDLVSAGALLHDVGRCRRHDIRHVSEGARIARDRGLPEALVRVIERHVGAGLTEQEARENGLPPGIYMPETLEEKIVCHADNLVKGPGGMQTLDQAIDGMIRKGYSTTAERMRRMHAELSLACGRDVDEIVRSLRSTKKVKGPCAVYSGQQDAHL